ncbi:RNA chaperone Hfq [Caballeronia sp. AZ10_KS36]|uniref:RNA chaperone Hfq n=1 Tax=Caballeronia sp. AZ10_KS36 TaxID=2921757 RepID=UPI002028EF56|nr:RNA chaperone Hfq [Caballeronia sp. AZ10_KS36]
MSDAVSTPQHEFLNALRKQRKRVSVFLVSGIKLTGEIQSFDTYMVYLNAATGPQAIFKRAISTISEDQGRPHHSERHERHDRPERRSRPGRRVP